VDTTIVPFLDDRGKPYQYIAIRADITALKVAEEALVQQAALAQLGQMAAVVAHEVRNPLAGIKGAMQVLLSRRSESDAEAPVMRDIVARIDSLGELINDIMVFARPRPPRLTVIDLHGLVMEAITMVRRDPSAASVAIAVEGDSGSLAGDGELIRAAVLNLLLNAAQALGGRGHIIVRLTSSTTTLSVQIVDDGPGIPAEIRDRVLEPFFTTKARGGGLGLPIAKRTAELHQGSLTIACPPGGGTVVTLTLPVQHTRSPAPA
jgi:signal transduction histidine kinase